MTDSLPINLWIYIGLRSINSKSSGYTYGLTEFKKEEIEIVDSKNNLTQIREVLYDISHYVLKSNITFKEGETIGFSEDEKINITFSKGSFVSGNSFKLTY